MRSLLVATLLAGVFGACSREPQTEAVLTPASRVGSVETAVEDIAVARCDREQSCKQVGPSRKYASREHCLNVKRPETRSELSDCKEELDQEDLGECVAEIRTQDCSDAVDNLEQWVQCSTDDLCD